MGVLLHLLLLLDALSASGGRRGGVLLYLLLLLDALSATGGRRGGVQPDSCKGRLGGGYWMPCRSGGRRGRPTLSTAATGCLVGHWRPSWRRTYLTSGGGAKAVVGVLLYLLLLLDALSASGGRRGGVLHVVWRRRKRRRGASYSIYCCYWMPCRPLEAVVAASIYCCYWMPSPPFESVVAASYSITCCYCLCRHWRPSWASYSISRCYWMPCRPVEAVVAASYLTSGGGAKAVVGVLLYLISLLDAFSATGGRRGGVLPDVWRLSRSRRGRPTLYLLLSYHWRPSWASYSIWMPSRPLESVVAAVPT